MTKVIALALLASILCSGVVADQDNSTPDSTISIETTVDRLVDALNASDFEAKFREIREKGRFTRSALLHNVASAIPSDRLPELFNWGEEFARIYIGNELQEIALRKLSLHDPLEALKLVSNTSHARKAKLIETIYEEWSAVDIEVALEHATHLSPSERSSALRGIIQTRHDFPEIKLRKIGRELGNEQLVADAIASRTSGDPISNHDVAWNDFVVSHGGDATRMSDTQMSLLSHITDTWALQNEGDEFVKKIFNNLTNDASRIIVLGGLADFLVLENPHQAFEIATAVGEMSRRIGVRVMDRVMVQWARTDGIGALAAATSIEDNVARYRNQRTVVEEWASADPASLLANRNSLPIRLAQFGHVEALKGLATLHPEQAADALSQLNENGSRVSVARAIAHSMAARDLRGAIQWVNSSTDSVFIDNQQMLHTVMLSAAIRVGDVQLAMEVALEQVDSTSVGTVVGEVADQHGSETALRVLAQVSDQKDREIAYFAIGNALVREGKSTQAISIVEEFPLEYQDEYFRRIGPIWAETEPHDLFDRLDDLPSDEIRSSLATSLAAMNAAVLSDAQKNKLKTIISSVFHQMLE